MTRGEYMKNLARPTKMPTLAIFKSTDRFNLKTADLFIPPMRTRYEVLSTPLREWLIMRATEIFIQKCRLSRTDLQCLLWTVCFPVFYVRLPM